MFIRPVGLMVLLLSSAGGQAAPAADELLSAFAASCPSQGNLTRTAIEQGRSLIAILEAVQKDPACVTLAGALAQANAIQTHLEKLQLIHQAKIDSAVLKAQEKELLLQIRTTHDDDTLLTLNSQLGALQVTLAGQLASRHASKKEETNEVGTTLGNIIASANVMGQQAVASQACLLEHPSLLANLATLVGTVSAAATLYDPLMSAGLSAGSEALGILTELARKLRISLRVRKLNQALTDNAIQCALEALSLQWCNSDDLENIIDFRVSSLQVRAQETPLLRSISVLTRELPVLYRWLRMVRVGSDPSTEADAAPQERVFDREAHLRSGRVSTLGIISQESRAFEQAKDNEGRWQIERRAIQTIVNNLYLSDFGGFDSNNPFADIYSFPYVPYYLLGLSQEEAPKANGNLLPFEVFNPFVVTGPQGPGWPPGKPPYQPDIGRLRARFLDLLARAQSQLQNDMAIALQPDPLLVIGTAFDASSGPERVSAYRAILTLIELLERASAGTPARPYGGDVFNALFKETVTRLKTIRDALNGVSERGVPSKVSSEAAIAAVQKIYEVLSLSADRERKRGASACRTSTSCDG